MTEAEERFASEVEGATMTMLKDDGVYRHLTFRFPKASACDEDRNRILNGLPPAALMGGSLISVVVCCRAFVERRRKSSCAPQERLWSAVRLVPAQDP
ncbi:MAG: hypothetical protein DLM60_08985 [Pseudonocardiales bacterium]|nr:MAG: hypothetical protein DLM60_08985 [Pseudonocardiales bacterium]